MTTRPNEYDIFGITHQTGLTGKVVFHTHIQYEIFVLHSGNVKYFLGNRIAELEPGDIIVMDGTVMHRPFIEGDARAYDRSIVQFSKHWLLPALKAMKLEKLLLPFEEEHFQVIRTESNEVLADIMGHIKSIAVLFQSAKETYAEERMMLHVMQLLLTLSQLKTKEAISFSDEVDERYEYVQQTIRFVENHYQEKLTLDDVADELNMSKSYLVHLFKNLTGSTIMEYIMNYRLKQAMHQLQLFPELTNQEVGSRCGFENASHFSRFFKQTTGVTPRDFRKLNTMKTSEQD